MAKQEQRILKIRSRNETFENFDESFGLQSNEFNIAAYFKDIDGEMFFGGIKGITSFYPRQIHKNNYAPRVIITDFKRLNQLARLDSSISYTHILVLSYDDYFFSFFNREIDLGTPTNEL